MFMSSGVEAITAEDVGSWDGFTLEHEASFPLDPMFLEFARKELGARLVNRADCASFFSRRLFIDYCIAVHEAYQDAVAPEYDDNEAYADPRAVRDGLSAVADSAGALLAQLNELNRFELALIARNFGQGAPRHKNWRGDLPSLKNLIGKLEMDARNGALTAASYVKAGTPKAALTHLIQRIAAMLSRHRVDVDAKPHGALHALSRLALEVNDYKAVFGEPKALKDSIRSALRAEPGETSINDARGLFRP